jgi:hypothetical protein
MKNPATGFWIAAALFWMAAVLQLIGRHTAFGLLYFGVATNFFTAGIALRAKAADAADAPEDDAPPDDAAE